jgi:hypothetical protein
MGEGTHRAGVGLDAASLFALFACAPFLLPVIGVQLGDIAFAIPFAMLVYAAARCAAAARMPNADRTLWATLALACGLGAVASGVALLAGVVDMPRDVAYDVGALASLVVGGAGARRAGGPPPPPPPRRSNRRRRLRRKAAMERSKELAAGEL